MSAISNINYVTKVFRHPCATPSIPVLVETAIPAAALALIEVFSFGCTDILKMRLGRKPWHSRGLNALIKKVHLGVKLGPRTTGFLLPVAPIEAALQFMLYADAATGFIANWMSLIYQEQRCTLPGAGYFSAPLASLFLFAGEHQMLIQSGESRPCARVGGNAIIIPRGCEATISFTAKFVPFMDDPANYSPVTTWLEEVGSGKRFSVSEGDQPPGTYESNNGGGHIGRTKGLEFDKSYVVRWSSGGGLMGCREGRLSVSAYGRAMPLIPSGCNPRNFNQPYPHAPIPPTEQEEENKNRVKASKDAMKKPKLKKGRRPPRKRRPRGKGNNLRNPRK